jgi:ribose transport system permease protein
MILISERRTFQRLLVLLVALITIFAFLERRFYAPENVLNILAQISIDGILACGMTLVVLLGGLDLSIGSVAALSGVLFVLMSDKGTLVAGAAALSAGLLAGYVNGFLISSLKLNSLIVTLGAMAVVQGLALWLSRGYPLPGPGGDFEMLGGGFCCYVPLPIVYFAAVALASHLLTRQWQFGRNIYAIGGSREAARIAQVPIVATKWIVYVISGALAAFAGMILASRLNTGSPIIEQDAPLQALVAVVLGGTSLQGGFGGIWQTVLGMVVLGVLSNGLNLLNVPPALQWGLKGLILIVFSAIYGIARAQSAGARHLGEAV